jgi:hypothetical protein
MIYFVFCKLHVLTEVQRKIEDFFDRESAINGLCLNKGKTVVMTTHLLSASGVDVLGTAI